MRKGRSVGSVSRDLCALVVAMLFVTRTAGGQDAYAVRVERPLPGEAVGADIMARGMTTVPPDQHVWLLARHTKFAPLWWPQREVVREASTGRWHGNVAFGVARDVGGEFEVGVAIVDAPTHAILSEQWAAAMRSNEWRPVELPDGAVLAAVVKVRKVRH
jgi:hypothetical protein